MPTVHVRVTAADTGETLPVRLRFVRADGRECVPLGYYADFPTQRHEDVGGRVRLGHERWYYIDGSCEIPLPGGEPLRMQVAAGPDYQPRDEMLTLGTGQLTLRLVLHRRWNHRSAGWMALDLRCHDITPHLALLEAAAEGLDVVQLLARRISFLSQDGHTYDIVPHLAAFSGQQPLLCRPQSRVYVNTLNEHPVLGRLALLHAHRPIFPLTFGEDAGDDWSLGDWCDQCHRKGGLTVWVDAFEATTMTGLRGGDALLSALLGQLDAIEVSALPRHTPLMPWLYHLWNAGVLLPLIGASAKESNRQVLGQVRTYVYAPDGDWVAAIKMRQCCVSDGPLLQLQQDGDRICAWTEPREEHAVVELVADGEVIARGAGQVTAGVPAASWVAARLGGHRVGHTAPIPLRAEFSRRQAAAAYLRPLIERTREWIVSHGRFSQPQRRQALLDRVAAALARLEQPPSSAAPTPAG
ncbi:MAG: hypothetical protein KatS3mg106_214 [Gemmataceae bacterium]|nr:MAG: hypothetical protein KatS3mg106_214 [Gemmataceae bacterium]